MTVQTLEISELLRDCEEYLDYLAEGCAEEDLRIVFQKKDSAVFKSWVTALQSIAIPAPLGSDDAERK